MDILIEPDCYKVCRICMESCEDDFVCVYDEFEDVILCEVIQECAHVEIRKNDALPRNVCRSCAQYMLIAYHTIQKCRESDVTLRSIFKHELNLHCGTKMGTDAGPRCPMVLQPEDMDPSDYEFLLSDAYDDMLLENGARILLEEHNRCNFTPPIDKNNQCSEENNLPGEHLAPDQQEYQQGTEQAYREPEMILEQQPLESLHMTYAARTHEEPKFATNLLRAEKTYESSETNDDEPACVPQEQKQCCGCKKLFDNEQRLREHSQAVHLPAAPPTTTDCPKTEGEQLRCGVCYRKFSTLSLLKEHQRSVNRKYTCAQCGKRFMTQTNLDIHSKCHKNKETYKCCGCRMDFEQELDLLLHSQEVHRPERTVNSEKAFECETCYRRYPTRKSLATHKRMIRQFQCQLCGAIFMKQLFLTLHLERVHHGEVVMEQQSRRCCGGCREVFVNAAALREHALQVHKPTDGSTGSSGTDDGKPFECDVCRKRFSSMFFLLQHQQKVFREKCYPCSICGRTFGRAHDLSNHETTHSNEMPFECGVCGRRFKNKLYLKNHRKLHTNSTKDHVCDECGKCFRTKELLKTHLISHSQERKHSCTVCTATFKRLQCLKIHMRIHTREKAFECPICRKRYVQSSDLKRHMLIHNPGDEGKPFQCEYCLRRYPRKDYLKVHIRKQHPHKPETLNIVGTFEAVAAGLDGIEPMPIAVEDFMVC
ncbi:zinc finger protein 420-like [Anopheles ziemanni]|uniref:zinc finger protein 420-like n=1 Tax=Anopheles coustani TaxID=139045 RepID=UPI00265ADFAE|nr:zinc finger protein 420-like [Anopheles coustani]XP_058167591.1 zinc finger protein 420-like [Anopheles ziemanni]